MNARNLTKSVLTFAAVSFVVSVLVSGVCTAASIGVNFTGGSTAGTHNVLPTDNPGVVAGDDWLNLSAASGAGVVLQDDTATPTTATLAYSAGGGNFAGFGTLATANSGSNTVYRGGLFGDGVSPPTDPSFTVANIPYATYDLYVFASQDTTNTSTLSISDGTTTLYYRSAGGGGSNNTGAAALLQTTSTLAGAPTVGKAQYQLFSGLSGPISVVEMGSSSGALSNNLFGFHIVDTTPATPEPSTFILATLGLLSLGMTRRRRRR